MSVLRLLDVSQYIHSGVGSNVISRGVSWNGTAYEEDVLPCAGLTNVLNAYFDMKNSDTDVVFCLDNIPTFKRELHQKTFPMGCGYKGNRVKKSAEMSVQRKMVAEVLKQCGLCVLGEIGYEADDVIASVVHRYKQSYDKVVIHSADSDLYHLVTDNVECAPVMRHGKTITRKNWEESVDRKYILKYNIITLNKLLEGETTDNIPAIDKEWYEKVNAIATPETFEMCGDNVWLRERVAEVTCNDPESLAIFDLIAPIIVPEGVSELYEELVNKDILTAYAIEFGCRGFRGNRPMGFAAVDSTIRKYMTEYREMKENF